MNRAANSSSLTVSTLDCITPVQVHEALAVCDRLLMESVPRIPLLLSREWTKRFPKDAGVYAVFDNDILIYVGQTGSLSARMTDFLDSRNHVLRRKLGNILFKDVAGFRRASAHERFPNHIEESIIEYIESHLAVMAVVVPLGRTEIEEYLIGKYRPRYNRKGKRGTKLHSNAPRESV